MGNKLVLSILMILSLIMPASTVAYGEPPKLAQVV